MGSKVLLFFVMIVLLPLLVNNVNGQVGGIEVPKGNNTSTQYCWSGTCQTPNTIPTSTISDNDTSHNELLSQYNIIMIIPSEVCTNAIKNHVKTDCPQLQEIVKYDNSNQKVSGYFYSTDGNVLERSNPQMKNHWQYYTNTNHTIICVYCTGNYLTTDLYKTIILQQSDSFEYAPHNYVTVPYTIPQYDINSGNFTDYTLQVNEVDAGLTTFLNRQVSGCNTATIAYSDALLNDTIHYLESGCKITSFNMTKTYSGSNTPWSYDNPYSSLLYKAVTDHVKNAPMGNCIINKCSQSTSTKKPGW